ncbi:MAG: hypothetical protein ACK56F_10015 [bacterium]
MRPLCNTIKMRSVKYPLNLAKLRSSTMMSKSLSLPSRTISRRSRRRSKALESRNRLPRVLSSRSRVVLNSLKNA